MDDKDVALPVWERRFVRDSNIVARRIAGETVLVPVRANVADLDCLFTLNEVGSLAWDLLDGQATVGQIAEQIAQGFEVSVEEAGRDLGEFLGALETEGLIRPVRAGAGSP